MDRRAFIGAMALVPLAAPLFAFGQPKVEPRRIGILSGGGRPRPTGPQALEDGLASLGWIEGRNLVIERKYANNDVDLLPSLAAELVQLKVEAIVTFGTPGALAARRATSTIPIVTAIIGDPVAVGLVASLARPGGNVTGNTLVTDELGPKRRQILRELVPKAKRIGQLVNPANPAMTDRNAIERDYRALDMQLIYVEVRDAAGLDAAFADLARQRAEGLIVFSDSLFVGNRARIAALAIAQGLPVMAEGSVFVEAGALISYSPDTNVMTRNAAVFVDKILRGAKPAELPVEQPTKFELVINMKTAKALGITIPQSLLLRADEVIQ